MAYSLTYQLKDYAGNNPMDVHVTHKSTWSINVLDDQGNSSDIPVPLLASANWLELERIQTGDDKAINIIGEQATIRYEYTGLVDQPLPAHFFDGDERRFRLEVYQDSIIRGVYYIKQDNCSYDYKYPPYTVELKAVDGLSFIKTTPWNAYDESGLLDYRWMSLYEVLIERGLLQVVDDTEVNVINTLKPENIIGDMSFLNSLYVHCDQFYDFVKGPNDVYTVLQKVCKQFYLRLFISQNKIWIERLPDMTQASIVAENYISGIYNPMPLPSILRTVGPDPSASDAMPVDGFAQIAMYAAIKKVEYALKYTAINQLLNFQWSIFSGSSFTNWANGAFTPSRNGAGTIDDPYSAFIPFTGEVAPDDPLYFLLQGSGVTPILKGNVGDIFQSSFKYKFSNTTTSYINIYGLDTVTGESIGLSSDGTWQWITGLFPPTFTLGRSGKKREGSFTVTSVPIPKTIDGHVLSGNVFQFFYGLHTPVGLNTLDGSLPPGIDIYPVKLGIYPISSAGRNIIDTNNQRVSLAKESQDYNFIDTDVSTISNTIAIDNIGTPAADWSDTAFPADVQDSERHMADANIDQYARAVYSWEGRLYSNTIDFWNKFVFDTMPDKLFIMMTDRYIVPTCTHSCNLQEVLPANSATTTYLEYDVEDVQ